MAPSREEGDADARDTHTRWLASEIGADGFEHALEHALAFDVAVEQQHELVAAEAGYGVAGAQDRGSRSTMPTSTWSPASWPS